jgi:cob(I)alamin adenosyltransferase
MTHEEALAFIGVARALAMDLAEDKDLPDIAKVLDVLEADHSDVAIVGSELVTAGIRWWCDPRNPPGSHPPLKALTGAEAGIAALTGATDRLVEIEDERRAAMDRLRASLLKIGLDLALKALPFLLAAL